jgi:hypothetical protein
VIKNYVHLIALVAAIILPCDGTVAASLPDYGTIILEEFPHVREIQGESVTRAPATARNVAREEARCGAMGYEFAWAPLAKIRDGLSHVRRLRELAEKRVVFDCTASDCLTVTRLRPMNAEMQSEEGLGVCKVSEVNGIYGAPEACKPLLVTDITNEYVLVKAGKSRYACYMGLPDFSLEFWGKSINRSNIEREIVSVLSNRPFNLNIVRNKTSIIGARQHLPSEVLTQYREWVTVRIDTMENDRTSLSGALNLKVHMVGLTISTTILINRQNTAGRADWSAASEQQEHVYINTVRDKLIELTSSICAEGTWIDRQHYNCDLPPSFQFPNSLE